MSEQLARFGHHPDPAIDFCVEVESLESIVTDKELGLRANELLPLVRFDQAMEFQVGGDASAMKAKFVLRSLEVRLKALAAQAFAEKIAAYHVP
jgi:hypothetical protein